MSRGRAMRPVLELSQQLAATDSSVERSRLVDAFVRDHTFPLVDEETAVFFARLADTASVHLVHWVFGLEGRQALLRLQDTDAFYLPVELPPASRVEYKYEIVDHAGKRGWIRDPLNPQRAFDPFGSNSVCAMPGYEAPRWAEPDPDTRPGSLEAFRLASTVYGGARDIQVYLPREYKSHKRYPLVLCHDGPDYLEYATMQRVLDNLIARREVAPLIVAFTSGGERNREYGADPRQPEFLVNELLPAMVERYGVSENPDDRGLMGASFGAVASLYTAWQHPGVFGRLLLQSGSFVFTDIGHHGRSPLFDPVVDFVNEFRRDVGRIRPCRVFLSCGTFESLIWFNRSIAPMLREAGVPARFVEASDGHNWIAWRDQLRNGLSWLFPGQLWMYYE